MKTLLLTPWMTPHKIVPWQTAVTLFFLGKVDVLEEYDEELRSPSTTIRAPAVVRLRKSLDAYKRVVKFSRINVFTRDGFRCQYCGERKTMRDLNYDHVLPRVRGGRTTWENIVTSCYGCNDRKGNKTPEEAGMRLMRRPFRPKSLPIAFVAVDDKTIPEVWTPYCASSGAVEEDAKGLFLMCG